MAWRILIKYRDNIAQQYGKEADYRDVEDFELIPNFIRIRFDNESLMLIPNDAILTFHYMKEKEKKPVVEKILEQMKNET